MLTSPEVRGTREGRERRGRRREEEGGGPINEMLGTRKCKRE
jgi:hypothetical protein